MKRAILLFGILSGFLYSCSPGEKSEKDFDSGLSVSNTGLTVKDAYLVDHNNQPIDKDRVPFDAQVDIVLQDVQNWVLKDGKAFPGLMITVTDPKGIAVIDEADLLKNANGYSPEDAGILRGKVKIGDPMKRGETYHVKMRVWDHNKPENEIITQADFMVQ
jgi:hypothetical protein